MAHAAGCPGGRCRGACLRLFITGEARQGKSASAISKVHKMVLLDPQKVHKMVAFDYEQFMEALERSKVGPSLIRDEMAPCPHERFLGACQICAPSEDDVYVVFPKPHAGDIKRFHRRLADDWYPKFPRATYEQWLAQDHPALKENK